MPYQPSKSRTPLAPTPVPGKTSHAGALPTRLIAAWGDSEAVSYHQTNVAKGQVILFGGPENADADPLAEIKSSPLFFDVTAVS